MGGKLRKAWANFKNEKPGCRFQDRYQRSAAKRKEEPWHRRWVQIFLALLLFLIGLVFVFIPGPAVLFFAGAAGMLANQSLWVARALDWTEVKCRAVFSWITSWWKRASLPARSTALLIGLAAVAAGGYLCYRVIRVI